MASSIQSRTLNQDKHLLVLNRSNVCFEFEFESDEDSLLVAAGIVASFLVPRRCANAVLGELV
jgi:hypothetical protein